jgi:transcriptional regulator with PAS, ATPase and Fis domain
MQRFTIEEICERFGIVAESMEMREILHVVQQVAPSDITVLITGESGTGKEIVATSIHKLSDRSERPMISVNCGAIPEGIIESELFGHEKGAFTSASEQRKGYFELADKGTIFLDEIAELPQQTQVKFLRVLENGEFMRVGSGVIKHVDVRIIAATNRDIEEEVTDGQFRADLYYRLRSVNIRIPPLRERRDDIVPLVKKFADDFVRSAKMSFGGFSSNAIDALIEYDWPGNIRELRNVVESLIVLEPGREIHAEEVRRFLSKMHRPDIRHGIFDDRRLPVHLHKSSEQAERELIYRALLEMRKDILELKDFLMNRHSQPQNVHLLPASAYNENDRNVKNEMIEELPSIEEMEKSLINEALRRTGGRRREAAKALQISERTLYRKIKEYGL